MPNIANLVQGAGPSVSQHRAEGGAEVTAYSYEQVRELVKRYREEDLQLTQSDLAWLADVSRGTIFNLESGRGTPDERTWQRVRDALALTRTSPEETISSLSDRLVISSDAVQGILHAILAIRDDDPKVGTRTAARWRRLVAMLAEPEEADTVAVMREMTWLSRQVATKAPPERVPCIYRAFEEHGWDPVDVEPGRDTPMLNTPREAQETADSILRSIHRVSTQLDRFREDVRGFERLPARVQDVMNRGLVMDYDIAQVEAVPGVSMVYLVILEENEMALVDRDSLREATRRCSATLQVTRNIIENLATERGPGEIAEAVERSLAISTNHREAANIPGSTGRTRNPQENRSAANFWASLNAVEQRDLSALGQRRVFARGATLMREGEPGDYVAVILGGHVMISVHEDGEERILAVRGPGDLIGERSALQVSIRSATVIASESVQALVVRTQEFADFVSVHPNILGSLEKKFYSQITGDDDGRDVGISGRHRPALAGENCTVVRTDVVEFGASRRNDADRMMIRRALFDTVQTSLGRLSESLFWEDRGDGLLVVVPSAIPTGRIMGHLHRDLPRNLELHNRIYKGSRHIRLRIAVDVGPVSRDSAGVSGSPITHACQLLEAPMFKERVASSSADIGIIASPFVYDTSIKHREDPIGPDGYSQVQVFSKETSAPAWMIIIDSTDLSAQRSTGL
jgi:DNA-binding XRE family transcriptional regulator